MAALADIEVHMQMNNDAIEACLQLYAGMSWSEYIGKTGDETLLNIETPQIPPGMMDAAYILQMIAEKEKSINECKAYIGSCTLQLVEIEKAETLQGIKINSFGGFGANFGANSFGGAAFGANTNLKGQLENKVKQVSAQEKALVNELWRHSALKVMDAVSFQAELSILLKHKLELRLLHKKTIAIRMIELRKDASQ